MKRVVVSGLGVVTPLGNCVQATWDALLGGASGIARLTGPEYEGFDDPIAAQVRDFQPEESIPTRQLRRMDRNVQFAVVAALEALHDAGFAEPMLFGSSVGVVFGAGGGGYGLLNDLSTDPAQLRRARPFTLPNILPDAASSHIAIMTGATGPNMAVLSASSSGASTIGEAAEIIKRGDAEMIIAGSTEAPIMPFSYSAFAALRAIAKPGDDAASACRPFDLNRSGFVVGEGSGALILESLEHLQQRGGRAYAELLGYGVSNDAFDMVATEDGGRGLVLAMSTALRKAGIEPDSVGYVNAHGTGSHMNDRVETRALKEVFGEHAYRLKVSSTKSAMGHLMGGAGSVEAVISILALHHGIVPPTRHYSVPDPECDLDYVPQTACASPDLQAVLSNSVGLGGHNAALIFGRPPSG